MSSTAVLFSSRKVRFSSENLVIIAHWDLQGGLMA